ncbi:MAG: TM2 domain-containing protein [Lachnospiraceae bacterium]|nr:TM2 domain-containing protein [Lachnospiraceae bacterium]
MFEGKKREVRYDSEGNKYKKFGTRTYFGYSYRDDWYPIANENPDRYMLLTVFGGWLGLHKFASREYASGLFYLLTCGGFAVFFLFDVFMILCGTYSVRHTEYYEDEKGILHKKVTKMFLDDVSLGPRKWIFLGIAGIIAAFTFIGIYMTVLTGGCTAIADVLSAGL